MMPKLAPTVFHARRWVMTAESGAYEYTLRQTESLWTALWESVEDFRVAGSKSGTLDEALKAFPSKIANKFRMVISRDVA